MLVAKRKNGDNFSLIHHWNRHELEEYRRKEVFFCPDCGQALVLKLGRKRIWHFSHQKEATCSYQYERESDYHLQGKLQLYQWLQDNQVEADIEHYLPNCNQRADVVFYRENKIFAVEFQCSPLDPTMFLKRTNGYLQHGITPIWILGGNQVKRLGENLFSLNQFQSLFLQQHEKQWYLLSYCSQSRCFLFLQHLIPISTNKMIGTLTPITRNEVKLVHLFHPPTRNFRSFSQWIHQLQKFKSNYYIYPNPQQRIILNEFYVNRSHLLTLPPELGLPVPSGIFIETPPLIWQSFLYLDLFHHLLVGDTFTYSQALQSFMTRIHHKQIVSRDVPLGRHGDYTNALKEYLQLLVDCSILDNNSEKFWIKCSFSASDTIDQQREKEQKFYQMHSKNIMKQFLSHPIMKQGEDV
ncbi:hypothetical protein M3182_10465 [Mesobacillus maritimus]|uniref:competence protein CoiA n=1 Tax=Mesobacillus maritimus TaxID=1643336 RepID=UPI0020409FA1|nr:competence protein CoiA family protein [Mesobacillus maritimus]MCM3586152.1 hypothetical protein [Mesobacillus maritimus]